MTLMVEVSCDAPNCDEVETESAGINDGVNVIETAGWTHTGLEDYCPDHAHLADE